MSRRLLVRMDEAPPRDAGASVEWALRESGQAVAAGAGPLSQLPADGTVELVAAAACVSLARVRLPQAPAARLRQMLAFAVEEQLLCDPTEVHVALGPALTNGEYVAAVLDRHWLEAWLAAFQTAGRPVARIWPESLLGPLASAEWLAVVAPGGGFVRTGAAEALSLEAGETAPPQVLAAALSEARRQGALPHQVRVRVVPGAPAPEIAAWQAQLGVAVVPDVGWDWRETEPAPSAFDLLQRAPAATTTGAGPRRLVIALLLLGMLQLAAAGADYARLAWQADHLRAHMRTTIRRVLPNNRLTFDRPADMTSALALLRARRRGGRLCQDWVEALAGAMQLAAPGSRLDTLHFDADGLAVELEAPQQDMIDPLTQQLDTAGFIVSTDGVASAAGDTVRVSLSLKPKPD